ncbi:MAG: thiamine pyrophosphate-dependent dehydrogenase E1 component subunit alpha [Chloroflexi bacterium]|nr:thiamine pyrophosphate-dependent dehydrogenase E1 component subunit alpha [Chloroflexota bacterium]
MAFSAEEMLALYRKMLLVRRMEEKHGELLASGDIWMMGHFGTGQEAVAIGITAPLKKEDYLFPTHRGVGEFIGKGMVPKDIWAEYYGRTTGLAKGKGGLHLSDVRVGLMGLVGSLGADFAVAVGTALSSKMRGTGQVTMIYFGDGTSNQADFHPSMNLAALWQLPIVFACANNQYSELAHYRETTSTEHIAPRAAGYGVPWKIVEDGNDIQAVYAATAEAVDRARRGEGPTLVEYKTYRIAAHFTGDPGGYQPKEEIEEWKKKDPIDRFRARIIEQKVATADDLENMNREVIAEVEDAVKYAQESPWPAPEDIYQDLYA